MGVKEYLVEKSYYIVTKYLYKLLVIFSTSIAELE